MHERDYQDLFINHANNPSDVMTGTKLHDEVLEHSPIFGDEHGFSDQTRLLSAFSREWSLRPGQRIERASGFVQTHLVRASCLTAADLSIDVV